MARLIDADALIDNMVDYVVDGYAESPIDFESYTKMVQTAPSIDIVFCKECKHEPICSHSVQHTTHEPTSVTIGYKSVEWCSYGERKDQ